MTSGELSADTDVGALLRPDRPGASWHRRLAAVPPNYFAVVFGLAGLGLTWRLAATVVPVPGWVADLLFVSATAIWAILLVGTAIRFVSGTGALARELADPVTSPFLALPAITALALAAGLFPHAEAVARVVALVATAVMVGLGGWLTGQWIVTDLALDHVHPGYFLPTVAGGYVAANVMALMGYRTIGWLMFGIGTICWMQIGSVILTRLLSGRSLPAALVPALAIEVAPPAVGGNAYFALTGSPDVVLYALAGFCILSVVVQLRFVPVFRTLRFGASFWAFTFSYSAVVSFLLNWIAHTRPAGREALAWLSLAAITAFVGAIAVLSVRAIVHRTFFPPDERVVA